MTDDFGAALDRGLLRALTEQTDNPLLAEIATEIAAGRYTWREAMNSTVYAATIDELAAEALAKLDDLGRDGLGEHERAVAELERRWREHES